MYVCVNVFPVERQPAKSTQAVKRVDSTELSLNLSAKINSPSRTDLLLLLIVLFPGPVSIEIITASHSQCLHCKCFDASVLVSPLLSQSDVFIALINICHDQA